MWANLSMNVPPACRKCGRTKDHHEPRWFCDGFDSDGVPQDERSVGVLMERLQSAYKQLREAWVKIGGGMDMQLQIRDPEAQRVFERRSAAAKKGAARRRARG